MNARYDAIIVGARCAGAATAMLLARAGLHVLVVDKSRYGADTLSTHALMRGAVLELSEWGLLDAIRDSGAPAVTTTTFYYGSEVIELEIPARDGVDALYAPRRTALDRILVDAAADAGAEFEFGARVDGVVWSDDRVTGVRANVGGRAVVIGAELVIGADGARSSTADAVGARTLRSCKHSTAVLFGYYEGLELDGYHWYYDREVSAGSIPTNGGHCVFAGARPSRLQRAGADANALFDDVIAEAAPSLVGPLSAATRAGGLRRFAGRPGHMKQAVGPGWALVGDAGYFKDPLTAHGITDALRDAELLSRAVVSGTDDALERYQTTRDDLSRELFDITESVASLSWTLEELGALHRALSSEMKREVRYMRDLHDSGERHGNHRNRQQSAVRGLLGGRSDTQVDPVPAPSVG